jgi:plastocyanin
LSSFVDLFFHPMTQVASATTSATAMPRVIQWGLDVPVNNFSLTINVGEFVRWDWSDSAPHTVTSGANSTPDNHFASGSPAVGSSFTLQFNHTGAFPYYCAVHSSMQGVITVIVPTTTTAFPKQNVTSPCLLMTCHPDALCFAFLGKATCICKDGFHGDGFLCDRLLISSFIP